ncbi:hypothetical protein BLNAU_7296 [Blattamonas nauphoetae]|uniref:Uncharacterized protein n=1 Tax=Blattamonas nauphoetae TaxID=2049346 RepID=A0ABQ9Y1N1_9EUKA|nr:hypothetical protein BLNAU_7296 [Blattamonas nauphoetae]
MYPFESAHLTITLLPINPSDNPETYVQTHHLNDFMGYLISGLNLVGIAWDFVSSKFINCGFSRLLPITATRTPFAWVSLMFTNPTLTSGHRVDTLHLNEYRTSPFSPVQKHCDQQCISMYPSFTIYNSGAKQSKCCDVFLLNDGAQNWKGSEVYGFIGYSPFKAKD